MHFPSAFSKRTFRCSSDDLECNKTTLASLALKLADKERHAQRRQNNARSEARAAAGGAARVPAAAGGAGAAKVRGGLKVA